MARKRKHDKPDTTTPSQNPYSSPRASTRTARDRADRSGTRAPAAEVAETNPWLLAAACLLLLLCTLLAFGRAANRDFGFVNLDDNRYVYDNGHVTQGLTRESITWAFTSLEFDNWHPLTWLSHQLDRQIFGPESLVHPWGYHLTSILLHAANVLVLFLALRQMTGKLWPSLLVAVLFGLHPLRAESVAWISERKDVLSGLFFFLALWAYAAYTQQNRPRPLSALLYVLVIVFFIAGLMAKPMVVILPVVLVLLDYWPLRRLWPNRANSPPFYPGDQEYRVPRRGVGGPGQLRPSGAQNPLARAQGRLTADSRNPLLAWILLEKVPLVALAAVSCRITYIAQSGAMKVIDDTIGFRLRLENALVSYGAYIGELFFPVRLAPLYPFPEHGVPWKSMAVAAFVLMAITAAVVLLRAWRWLAVGWLWYIAGLLPVIGLVQVGVQAMADRYTYLPHIGLYIMLAWSAEKLTANLPARRWIWAAALALLAPLLICLTFLQTATWKDSETLWTSALKANPNIALAENNLGYIVQDKGQKEDFLAKQAEATGLHDEALKHHNEAARLYDQAFQRYEHAVNIRKRYVEARINLGNMYMHRAMQAGSGNPQVFKEQTDEALKQYREAVKIRPDFEQSYVNLGTGLMVRNELVEAEANFRTALKIDPRYVEAYWKLGMVLCRQKKFDDGIAELRKAVEIAPGSFGVWQTLAETLVGLGRYDEAIPCYELLRRQPAIARDATGILGTLYYVKRQPRKALQYWASFLNNNPDSLPVLTMTAWLLATDPDPAVRNGGKALVLAQRAAEICKARNARVMTVLAAAYAETGDFRAAVQTIEQASRLLDPPFSETAMAELQRLYQAGGRYYDDKASLQMPLGGP